MAVENVIRALLWAVLCYVAYKHVREFVERLQCRRRQRLTEWQPRAAQGEPPGFEVKRASVWTN